MSETLRTRLIALADAHPPSLPPRHLNDALQLQASDRALAIAAARLALDMALAETLASNTRANIAKRICALAATLDAKLPYPFCVTPDRCAGLGSCPRDPTCAD